MISSRRASRVLGIVVLVLLCAGAIVYSARSVRYQVDQTPTSEFTITDLSLTHSVERDSNGALTNPYVEKTSLPAPPKHRAAVVKTSAPKAAKPAAPKIAKKEVKPTPVVKRPAVKKPSPKKLLPKKPAPKKPRVKKPDPRKQPAKKPADRPARPKACPT